MAEIPQSEQANTLVVKIADTLGVPVAAFYEDALGDAGELLTLMRLWSAIDGQQARRRVLIAARQEFERSEGSQEA